MAIIIIIIALLIGAVDETKDAYDVQKWRNNGGMANRYDCWKK